MWSDNEEIRLGNETDDIIKRLFNSFLNNYQKEEIVLRNGSNFVFESVDLLSYHIHKTSLKRGKSYIKSPEWILNKRATINPKNKDNKCFQYSITVALNHQNIESHPERISNIKPFVDQYNWKGIDFPAEIKDWKKFEKSLKVPFTIYVDLECLLIKQQSCQNNPNESYTERKAMHEPCGYALSLISSFDSKLNKHNFYRKKDCIERFCSDLKEFRTKIVNDKQKEMTALTNDDIFLYES